MDISNRTLERCQDSFNSAVFWYRISLLCLSVVILIVLSFFQRRKKRHGCLWGFPGIVKPMDFLEAPRHRFVYILIFGVMSQSLISTFQTIATPAGINFYFRIVYRTLITPLLVVLILSLQYFPLFACISASVPLLGHTIGFIYSFLWMGYVVLLLLMMFPMTICLNIPTPPVTALLNVATSLPTIGVALLVTIWYGFKTVQGIFGCFGIGRKLWWKDFECCGNTVHLAVTDAPRVGVKTYHLLHVQRLFQSQLRKESDITKGRGKLFLWKIIYYIFPYSKDFRLPLPFVGAVFAMSMILYQFTVLMIIAAAYIAAILPPVLNNVVRPILNSIILNSTIVQSQLNVTSSQIDTIVGGVEELLGLTLVGLPAFLVICPIVSLVFCLCLMINMVATVSKQLKQVAKEGFKVKLPSPIRRVPSSWKYLGYQIGFFTLAWLIYTFIIFLVLVIIGFLYLAFKYLTELAFQIVLYIVIPLVWTQLALLLQSIICRYIFFEDQKGSFIAIKNTRLFNWFAYVLFFYNGIAGFVGAILRTLVSAIFSLLLLFRLDQVVLIKGFEQFDFGHTAYLGFIYLEATYNNAVMHVFLHLLQQETQLMSDDSRQLKGLKEGSRRARNRWLVAYTLIRNPTLVQYTASNLHATAALITSGKDGHKPEKSAEGQGDELVKQL